MCARPCRRTDSPAIRHQRDVSPVPGISRQESHARVSPVWCGWGGDTTDTDVSLKGFNPLGNHFGVSQGRVVGAATHCKELCGAVLLLPSRSGVKWGAGGSRDLPRVSGSSPSPCVSAPGVAVSWWKGRNPLLEQLCPPGGCCRAVPILSSVPTSAGREAVESPSAVAMTAPSTAPSRCPSHRDKLGIPSSPGSHLSCTIPFPLPAQGSGLGSRKEAGGSPIFPFPAP